MGDTPKSPAGGILHFFSGSLGLSLKLAEPAQGIQFFGLPYFCPADCLAQKFNTPIIGLSVHGIGVAVFAPMCKAETCRVSEAGGYPIDKLGYQAQCSNGLGDYPLQP